MSCRLTIVIPTYNRCSLLKRAWGSCLAQTNKQFEVIFIDNGSNDGTRNYIDSLASEEILIKKIFNAENIGAVHSISRGLFSAQTEWVTILCDDDWLADDFVENFYLLQGSTTAKLIIVGFNECDELGLIMPQRYTALEYSPLQGLKTIYSHKVKTAGISGFFFARDIAFDLFKLRSYPKGFFSDTYFVSVLCLRGGVCVSDEIIYNRAIWSGSETNSGSQKLNRKLYRRARLMFRCDMLKALLDYEVPFFLLKDKLAVVMSLCLLR